MSAYRDFHRRSLEERDGFWAGEARLVHWEKPFERVLDYSRPPFARWFVGGRTNLCYNAVDRHLPARAGQEALAWVSTEVDQARSFTALRSAAGHMQMIADPLAEAIVKQFPGKFTN